VNAIEVRTYKGRSQEEAARHFAEDAPRLEGLQPTSQSWSPPQTWRLIVTPLVLLVVGYVLIGWLGVIIAAIASIVYMVFARPQGSLSVTFARTGRP
jgi:hypothetical protein